MNRKKLVEAALFISGKEIKREELAEMLQMEPAAIEKVVNQLSKEYEGRDSCLIIRKSGNVYKMDIDQGYVEAVKKLAPEIELSRGLLKALSFIAYKQPARQSDLVKIIGNRAYDYVNELEERGFITRERWGRTRKLETTDKFATYFGTDKIALDGVELKKPEVKKSERKEEKKPGETGPEEGKAEGKEDVKPGEGPAEPQEDEGETVEEFLEETGFETVPEALEGAGDEGNIQP